MLISTVTQYISNLWDFINFLFPFLYLNLTNNRLHWLMDKCVIILFILILKKILVHVCHWAFPTTLSIFGKTVNKVAAFRGMHVSPAKHSYAWLPRKCDYLTNRQTPNKVIPMCRYASQATQKCKNWHSQRGPRWGACHYDLDLLTPKSIGVFLSLSSICVWSMKFIVWGNFELSHYNKV